MDGGIGGEAVLGGGGRGGIGGGGERLYNCVFFARCVIHLSKLIRLSYNSATLRYV